MSVVRLKPFNTETEEGRAQERYRRVALNSLSAALAKGIQILSLMISVPLTLKYLGEERYGMWMTISSVLMFLGFADLGLGLGLQNSLSKADGEDDKETARRTISSGFFMLTLVGLGLFVGFAILYPFLSWASVFNVQSPRAVSESGVTLMAVAVCFALNLPVSVVNRTQLGYQQSFLSNLWQCLGSVLGLVGLLLAIHFQAGLPWLALAAIGGPVAAMAVNSVVYFGAQNRFLSPSLRLARRETCLALFRIGAKFLAVQVLFALGYHLDNLLIAHTLDARAVAVYAVCMRLFGVIPMLVNMVTGSLWPAYGEAYARGDTLWIRRTLVGSLKSVTLITGVASLLLVLSGQTIIRVWTGGRVNPSFLLLLGMGVWTTLDSVRYAFSNFLGAISLLRFQAGVLAAYALGAALLKIFFGKRFHLEGIIWAGALASLVFYVLPSLAYARTVLRALAVKG